MTITTAQIRKVMPNAKREDIEKFVSTFNKWAEKFGIDTPLRAAHFIGQVAHECGELRYMEEIASGEAYDTGKLAQKLGNTPEKDGDGQLYKGRGCLQLTGKSNYQAYASSEHCVGDLMSHPEWLAKYPGALKSAMWYWQTKGLNKYADRDDVEGVTRKINGGLRGLAQRGYYTRMAKRALFINKSL